MYICTVTTTKPQTMTTPYFSFSDDFQTCTITLADGRTATLESVELTPHGESVDTDGYFFVTDTDTAYRDEDGTVSHDSVEKVHVAEHANWRLTEQTVTGLVAAALGRSITYEVSGVEYDWRRRVHRKKVEASDWADLVHQCRHWHRIDGVTRCGAVGSGMK